MRLGPERRRSLLAVLLLHRGRAVPLARLAGALWADGPPANARAAVQSQVSRLRALLAGHGADRYGVRLETVGDGYCLRLPAAALDLERFRTLTAGAGGAAGAAGREPAAALAVLEEALALWHGPALAGTAGSPLLDAWRQTLEDNRLDAVELLAEQHLRLGRPERAAELLRAERAAHPLRESLAAGLVLALHAAGRPAEALACYRHTHDALAARLGVDPGAALRAAHAYVRHGAPAAPAAPAAAPAAGPTAGPTAGPLPVEDADPPAAPLLAPPPPRGFHGREDELARLDEVLSPGREWPIALVTGPAGVGKTALALHWAHRQGERFPGGVLFADLGRFGDRPDRELGEVLGEFLIALGVPPRELPAEAAARAARYEQLTRTRRVLVVVDDARESARVRPLLPAGAGSAVLVTSRHRLPGLIATELARPVPLAVLGPEQSAGLLARVLGPERIAADPAAARELAELCGGLPLALRITAAKAAADPQRALAALAGRLRDERRRLGHLAADELSVTSALRLSHEQLPPTAARLFRALGLHPGPLVDTRSAAALADLEHHAAAEALEQLAATHLVDWAGPEEYVLHDLVWLYARQLAAAVDPSERAAALGRLADRYLRTGLAADAAVAPDSPPCCEPPAAGRHPCPEPEFTGAVQALRWLGAHRETLGRVIAAAAPERAWQLVLTQWPLIVRRTRDGWVPQLRFALAAAVASGHPDGESQVRALLGWVLFAEERLAEAADCLAPAPGLADRAGSPVGRAVALVNLAAVQAARGETTAADRGLAEALETALAAENRRTVTLALHHRAHHLLATGRPRPALEQALRGLELADERTPFAHRVRLHTACGEALAALGRHPEARSRLLLALGEAERRGEDRDTAEVLRSLARAEGAAGRVGAAIGHWQQAERLSPR
nr:BTAD domain-containing putative transcriptional regulator [Kitasatospora sp. SID7827]